MPSRRETPSRLRWALSVGLVPALALLAGVWLSGTALAAPPWRVGLYHPQPHLCPHDEPSQRDLRVLRAIWRVGGTPERWRAGPSFFRWEASPARTLALDTEALWGMAPGTPGGVQPDSGERFGENRLTQWTRDLTALLPFLEPQPGQAPGRFTLAGPDGSGPFLPSRLAGFQALPDLDKDNISSPDRDAVEACRAWPAWARWETGGETWAYRVILAAEGGERPRELRGYSERTSLWRDYLWGRLDALLLEGPDIDSHVSRRRRGEVGPWGVAFGGQQLVLRWIGGPEAMPGASGRAALSRALDRRALGKAAGVGWFLPQRSFMTPWLAPDALPTPSVLQWDALGARRAWLKEEHTRPAWRLLVLKHPLLKAVAEGIQAQWRRTLNLEVAVEELPVDRWVSAVSEGRGDWMLDVVDMDDGTLQALWQAHLPRDLTGGAAAPEAMEEALRAGLPYLPLLGNAHWVLLRKDAPAEALGQLCPGCFRASSPVPLRADPVERVDPQG